MATDDELDEPVAAAADWLERVAGADLADRELVDGEMAGANSPSTSSERETTDASLVKILGSALGLVTS